MNKLSGQFGEVFRHKGKNYVFIVQINEILYVALIISKEDGDQLNVLHDRQAKRNPAMAQRALDSKLFRLVLLTTEEFKNQWAYLYDPQYQADEISLDIIGETNREDKIALRQEILEGTYQEELKQEVRKIVLQ